MTKVQVSTSLLMTGRNGGGYRHLDGLVLCFLYVFTALHFSPVQLPTQLGARVPQICKISAHLMSPLLTHESVKNFQTRCEGLSPALFFFAIFGNSTYALSICAKSMNRDYLIKNAGWLAGK